MKIGKEVISRVAILGFIAFGIFLFASSISASSITGTIYDNHNNSLTDVDVELLDDFYRLLSRTRTEGTGRYEFSGLGDGRYTVRVLPFRYDFLDQSQLIEINTSTIRGAGQGNTLEIKDFYLQPRRGSLEEAEAKVVFAQSVPKEAEKAYKEALADFSKKRREEAVVKLQEALKLFPDYFLALNRLGKEYVVQEKYSEAYQILMKAVGLNPKSPVSFYFLGYALYKLNYNKAALIALNQAYVLSPSSVSLLVTLGTVERLENKYADSEKHLLQAKKLSRVIMPEIHFELARLYGENLKKYAEAADELEAFLKLRPDAQDALKIKELIKKFREKAKEPVEK